MNTAFDDHLRALWSGKAAAYQESFAGMCAYPMPFLLDATGVGPGTTVLDVGCGTGTLSELAQQRGARVSAVDAEPSMVESTRLRVPGVRAGPAVLPELPFAAGTFDVVVANFVVNHVGRPAPAVAELLRVTRAGNPLPPLQRLWGEVIEAAGVVPPVPVLPRPEDNFPQSQAGLAELLRGAGLAGVESTLIEWQHRVDPEQWWSGAANGVAGIGYVVSRQDPGTVARMKLEYDRIVAGHLDEQGRLALATAAVLTTGTRPSNPS
jgi:SAM-dependent methyltransferase